MRLCICVGTSKIKPIIIERTNAPTNDVRNSNGKKSEKRKCNSINHAIVCGHRSAGRHVKYVRPSVSIVSQASPNKFRIRLLSIKARRSILLNLFDPMKLSTTAFKKNFQIKKKTFTMILTKIDTNFDDYFCQQASKWRSSCQRTYAFSIPIETVDTEKKSCARFIRSRL